MERLHWLLERAFDEDIGHLSATFTSVHMRAHQPTCTCDPYAVSSCSGLSQHVRLMAVELWCSGCYLQGHRQAFVLLFHRSRHVTLLNDACGAVVVAVVNAFVSGMSYIDTKERVLLKYIMHRAPP